MNNDGLRGGVWLAPLLAGAVLGLVVQVQQPVLWSGAAYGGLAAAGLLLAGLVALAGRGGWSPVGRGLGTLAAVALLAFAVCGLRAAAFGAAALSPALEGTDVRVTGRVAVLPQPNELGLRFILDVEAAQAADKAVTVPPRILLSWYGGARAAPDGGLELQRAAPVLRAGDRWRMTARLKAPHGNSNPHGFDYELWLWEQGVQATGYVRAGRADPAPQRLEASWRHPVERARQATRDAIYAHLAPRPGAPGDASRRSAGLVAALVVGDQNAIDRADWDVFRATGTAHLMSISGLHITLFAWAAAMAVGAAWRRSHRACLLIPAQHAALIGGLLLAGGYALFSGWGVPAQRTVWMLAAVTLLRLSGRHWPWPMVWLLAAAVVLTVDPWAVLQPGFWLSFVAVGVLFASGPAPPASPEPAAGARRLLNGARGLLREQAVVTAALAPLTLLLFGQMSIIGLVANLLAIPWVTFLVTPLALAGIALPLLWDAAAGAAQVLGWVLARLADLPFATWSAAAPPLWVGAVAVLGGVLLALRLPLTWRLLGLPLVFPVLFWPGLRPMPGEFELLAADIGQGNAVVVRTAHHTLVYDAGPRYSAEGDAGHRVLVPLLRALDDRVHVLVVSHRDSDHSGGARSVLAAHAGATLLSSVEPDHDLQRLRQVRRCESGQRWTWDGVDFEVLHPQPVDYIPSTRPNALSCVLRVANGHHSALLAGDIEQAQEARLVAAGAPLAADFLLVPHHGSKTSSSAAFIEAVRPRWAVVQSGYRNRFGHPADVVMQRYRDGKVRTVDSARCGAARWSSADPDAMRCQREQAPRYWHHRVGDPAGVALPGP